MASEEENRKNDQGGSLILVVEDDPTLSELLAYNLRRAGYLVRQAWNGRLGVTTAIEDDEVDLVLMDLMLPGIDGLVATRQIREHRPKLPLIILTARSERETILKGFQSGADDYVPKPFDMDVLLARIAARLTGVGETGPQESAGPQLMQVGDLVLDHDDRTLSSPRGSVVLKPKEHRLLELLFSAPGHLFTREEIVERVWRQRYSPGSRSLDVHMLRVRQKLEPLTDEVRIATLRGAGYRLVGSPETEPAPERRAF